MGLEFETLKEIGAFLKVRRKDISKSLIRFGDSLEADESGRRANYNHLCDFERGVFPRERGQSGMYRDFILYMNALDLNEDEQEQIKEAIERYYESRKISLSEN